ncbi:MAG: hypothetical protein KatS3mg060_3047 [Dehalococcoidia bacterium]|nr:MAG: hypothetical protein KatS3mg060_3047 [Dehalococcoidia bacterium]
MQSIVIVSTRPGAGKTALAAALVELVRRDGRTAGYFKAFEANDIPPAASPDARFMGTMLGVADAAAGASLGGTALLGVLDGQPFDRTAVIEAARRAGATKDVVFVEGGSTLSEGLACGLSAPELAEALDAKVIAIARYEGEAIVDEALAARNVVGDRLLGVVVNGVPRGRWDATVRRLRSFFQAREVPFLGALPFEETLAAVTVQQLADHLGGQIMNSADRASEIVENFMVGTVVLGKASDYFRRMSRKAVIAHGSRPDMHLAALETDTRCLVLAGNIVPNPIVLARAEEEDVPIIMVKQDTLAVLEQIEELFPTARFAVPANVPLLADLVAANLDLGAIRAPAGAAS